MADLVIRGRRVVTDEGVRPGARVSAETCPHYLTLAAEEIRDGATQHKCTPPVRGADLVVFDPAAAFRVDPAGLHHCHPVTPYAGHMLHGVVLETWLWGRMVHDRGRFAPPTGTALLRETTDPFGLLDLAAERLGGMALAASDEFFAPKERLLEAFAGHDSRSLQQTLFAMGEAVLARRPEVAEVRMAMSNKHHLPVDLTPYGLRSTGEVFVATDRPYGLIEGTVTRDGAPPADAAWA
jgi:Uricase